MPSALSQGTALQLLGLGIPAEKHNYDELRRIIPPFEGIDQVSDVEALAEIVVYLGRHRILSVETNSWKALPWGTHACLFYKSTAELTETFRNYFRDGLAANERCVWIVHKAYGWDRAVRLAGELLKETGKGAEALELVRHEDWYESSSGRFRSQSELFMGWINKIEGAFENGYEGIRVTGDAYCHPNDLKSFFDYERKVNEMTGTLKIKAICTYCIPNFGPEQISQILSTHQDVFGDFAVSGRGINGIPL